MIGALTGTVISRNEKHCIIDVRGVGYKVYATPDTLEYAAASAEVFLYIHTVVREDALELFGFRDETGLDMFERLTSISGIGPRSALGVLSVASTDDLRNAIVSGDITFLTKVSGIGKKTAEKILLELRDSLSKTFIGNGQTHTNANNDVLAALESLGYSTAQIRDTLQNIPKDISTEDQIKQALQYLAQ